MTHDKILILDFGSQVTQLIARRVREAHVYCEIHPNDVSEQFIRDFAPKGVILSGSHASTYEDQELRAPQAPPPSPKVIYVENARAPRPGWRIGLGVGLLAASSLPLGFGGRALYLDGACSDTPTGMQTRCTSLVDTKGLGGGLVTLGVIAAIGGIVTLAIPGRVLHVQRPAAPAEPASPEAPKPLAESLPLLPLSTGGTEPMAAARD